MPSNYQKDDPILGYVDLDDAYITDAWLVDQFVGNRLLAMGTNTYGQLGLGDIVHRSSPVQVGSLVNWKLVESGTYHIAAIKTDGTLWTWGSNSTVSGAGQLGLNDLVHRSSPTQVGSLTNWKSVSGGLVHTAAIKTDGTLWTWGNNNIGALGLGDIVHRSSPTQVGSLTNWRQVVTTWSSCAATKTDGTLWTWGDNGRGQLGTNNIINYSSPVQVGTLTNWKSIAKSTNSIAAIKTDGTLWTWGRNDILGTLGLGDLVNRSSPTQVGSLTNWKSIFGGWYQFAAIKTDGTLWIWGHNTFGRLGLGDQVHRSSPTQVGSLTNWKSLALGSGHTLAIKTDGTLWTWGRGDRGQTGQNNVTSPSSPVQVGSLTNWKLTSAGSYHSVAVTFTDI